MKESENNKLANDDIDALAEAKLPLVLRDYESWYEASSREQGKIIQLREWEVTLVSALAVVLLTRQSFPTVAVLPLYFIVVVFALLESAARANIEYIGVGVREAESELQVTTVAEFRRNIANWTFGNYRWDNVSSRVKRYRLVVKFLFSRNLLLWHSGLILSITVLLIFI